MILAKIQGARDVDVVTTAHLLQQRRFGVISKRINLSGSDVP
jgi:hypothetical protein